VATRREAATEAASAGCERHCRVLNLASSSSRVHVGLKGGDVQGAANLFELPCDLSIIYFCQS